MFGGGRRMGWVGLKIGEGGGYTNALVSYGLVTDVSICSPPSVE